MSQSSQENTIITCLFVVFSVIGFFSSITILILIKIMKRWNGYLAIIWSAEVCQLFYDASFSLYNIQVSSVQPLWTGLQFFGGLSTSIWTNILSFVVLYVVFRMSSFDILGYYYVFCGLALIPALLLLVLHMVYSGDDTFEQQIFNVYYYLRFLSIVFNFCAFLVIAHRARLIKSKSPSNKSPVEVAINVLSMRMIYYPFMQAVTVLPASIYESLYGIHQADPNTTTQFTVDCIFAVLTPSAGLGYLVIFLIMQPNAYKHFKAFVTGCRRYHGPGDSSGVPDSNASTNSTVSSIQQKSIVISMNSANTDTNNHHKYNHGQGVNMRDDSSVLLMDRMQYMEDDELLSEIDNNSCASNKGGGSRRGDTNSRNSNGSMGWFTGSSAGSASPFWGGRQNQENLSVDSNL